jgi:hypothetical protein
MALAEIRPVHTQQRIHDLVLQWHSGAEQERLLEETRQCVRYYERAYNLSSDRIHEAIDAGELVENLDVSHWIFLCNILRRVS